jgi:hypothetical protein
VSNEIYFKKRDTYYYLEFANKSQVRDNLLSDILGVDHERQYYQSKNFVARIPDITTKIYLAKFWKDRTSALWCVNSSLTFRVVEIGQEEFINLIPDKVDEKDNANYLRNIKNKRQEIKYLKEWKEFRKKYKCTSAYKKVDNPHNWLPCKNCGLIPLIREFDNGSSTACGCGENDYNHFSIQSESVMSFYKRNKGSIYGFSGHLGMNWNQWVLTGQDIFKEMKKNNPEIW